MSMQDINLLTEDLRPKRELFTFRDLMFVWGGFLALLLCFNGYQSIGWLSQGERAAEVREHLRTIQAANAALTAEAQRKPEPSLVASVAELNAVRAERELLATLLQDVATSDGFSERLEDLARFKLQGIWLDGVFFGDGGTQVRLRGFSETPGRVPEYLSALSAGAGFSGYSFEGFELSDAPNNLVKFELAGPDSAAVGGDGT